MSIEARAVSYRYGDHLALDGLDFSATGGVVGLLGPNGAGKTTFVRLLATDLLPQSGTIRILGQNVQHGGSLRQVRRYLGYLPQRFGYHPNFTVREFITYIAWLREVPGNELSPAVEEALTAVGLLPHADLPLRELSAGMLRRAGIACAIVNRPRVLLLDEPTAGLDPEQRTAFRALVRHFGRSGLVVISTHLVEDVIAACTEVAIMYQGRIVFRGTPDHLSARGEGWPVGDTPGERGYLAILARARGGPAVRDDSSARDSTVA